MASPEDSRVVVITGANEGIGYHTLTSLIDADWEVIERSVPAPVGKTPATFTGPLAVEGLFDTHRAEPFVAEVLRGTTHRLPVEASRLVFVNCARDFV